MGLHYKGIVIRPVLRLYLPTFWRRGYHISAIPLLLRSPFWVSRPKRCPHALLWTARSAAGSKHSQPPLQQADPTGSSSVLDSQRRPKRESCEGCTEGAYLSPWSLFGVTSGVIEAVWSVLKGAWARDRRVVKRHFNRHQNQAKATPSERHDRSSNGMARMQQGAARQSTQSPPRGCM